MPTVKPEDYVASTCKRCNRALWEHHGPVCLDCLASSVGDVDVAPLVEDGPDVARRRTGGVHPDDSATAPGSDIPATEG